MNAASSLVDIAKVVGAIDPGVAIKIANESGQTYIVAADGVIDLDSIHVSRLTGVKVDGQFSVVCYGKLHESIPELDGKTIGLERIPHLVGFAKLHTTSASEFKLGSSQRATVEFDDGKGFWAQYWCTPAARIKQIVRIPNFIEQPWDVVFYPSAEAISVFSKVTRDEEKNDQRFCWPMMNSRGYLYFSFDQEPPSKHTDRFEMARGLPYAELAPFSYPAKTMVKLLRHASTAKSVAVKLTNRGCLAVEVDSGIGIYCFIVPGSPHLIHQWHLVDKFPHVSDVHDLIRDDQCMHGDWEPNL